jgi:hypothetical protein
MKKTILSIAAAAFLFTAVAGTGEPDKENPFSYCTKLKNGKIEVTHDGMALKSDVTLSNGTKIMTDGTVIKADGTKMKLKEGQCINKEGVVVKEETKKEKTTKTKDKTIKEKTVEEKTRKEK